MQKTSYKGKTKRIRRHRRRIDLVTNTICTISIMVIAICVLTNHAVEAIAAMLAHETEEVTEEIVVVSSEFLAEKSAQVEFEIMTEAHNEAINESVDRVIKKAEEIMVAEEATEEDSFVKTEKSTRSAAGKKISESTTSDDIVKVETRNCDLREVVVEVKSTMPTATPAKTVQKTSKEETSKYNGEVLNSERGRIQGPSGEETYYNLPMEGVIGIMQDAGYDYTYWVRDDGVKMYGDYVMVAADLSIRPRGSLIETSLGTGIVCDTGEFINQNQTQLDIAVIW